MTNRAAMPYWSRSIVFASSLLWYCIRLAFVLFPFVSPEDDVLCAALLLQSDENESVDAGMSHKEEVFSCIQ